MRRAPLTACAEAYRTLSSAALRDKYNLELEQALKDDEEQYTGQVRAGWAWTVPSCHPEGGLSPPTHSPRSCLASGYPA